jgi:hypothetical protein
MTGATASPLGFWHICKCIVKLGYIGRGVDLALWLGEVSLVTAEDLLLLDMVS